MSMDFDGVNDIINNGTGTSMDNLITMSYCSWFFSDANPENNIGYILCRTSGSTLGEILSRQTGTGSADRNIVFFSRYSTFGGWNSPAGSILNLKWYFVAVTYDGGSSSNNPTIYINGNSVEEIISNGFDKKIVESVIERVKANEHKRNMPAVVKIS